MRKSKLLQLLHNYKQNHSIFDKDDVRIYILEYFLEGDSIKYHRGMNDEIPFAEFVEFIIDSFVKDDVSCLFTQAYLKSGEKGAALFNDFISAEKNPQKDASEQDRRNKQTPASVFTPRDDKNIKPSHERFFTQDNLVFFGNITSLLRREGAVLNMGGVCCALTFIWFEYINNARDLLSELNKSPINQQLLKRIGIIQEKIGTLDAHHVHLELTFANIKERLALKKENDEETRKIYKNKYKTLFRSERKDLLLVNKKPNQVANIMASFDFAEAQQKSVMRNEFANYMDELRASKQSDLGLHTIGTYDFKSVAGHIIGWTYKKGKYVVFDANQGEAYFDSFAKLKGYLCNFVNKFTGYGAFNHDNVYFIVNDYYDQPSKDLSHSLAQ